MNREGVIWIAIRVFGVYLLVCGALEVPRLFSSSYGVYWSWSWYRMHMNQAIFPPRVITAGLQSPERRCCTGFRR